MQSVESVPHDPYQRGLPGIQRADWLQSCKRTSQTKHTKAHSDCDRSTTPCKEPICHGMSGPHECRALSVHLISQDPRWRAGNPPDSHFQVLEGGKLIAAYRSESLRAGRENDWPGDPKSLRSGQNDLVGHSGATRVIVACSLTCLASSLWIRASGG